MQIVCNCEWETQHRQNTLPCSTFSLLWKTKMIYSEVNQWIYIATGQSTVQQSPRSKGLVQNMSWKTVQMTIWYILSLFPLAYLCYCSYLLFGIAICRSAVSSDGAVCGVTGCWTWNRRLINLALCKRHMTKISATWQVASKVHGATQHTQTRKLFPAHAAAMTYL